ncbi:MAG TPA: endonuclease/exonuclease/phosphatase family protein [Thermomonospora sp.]|nr:endonuclease/exonuclease/phosphatase family protein [Thermomonospora sp.]
MRVVTWNVWWRFGPWERRREAILAVLRDLRPDLVGLQEVWGPAPGRDGAGNLAEWLADGLGLHWVWAASHASERWHRRAGGDATYDVGNAVLSRWRIGRHEVVRLPRSEGQDGQFALHAMVDAPGYRVPFFTTHLNSEPHGSATRCAQVRALAECVAARRDGTPFPPVVTGDFNALPDSDEIRLLGGFRTAPPVPGQVFMDAWDYADPAAPSATWDNANPFTARTLEPNGRVDYIHVGLPGPGGLGHVRAVRRAGDAPVDGVWPSDHAAVVAELADTPR